MKEISYGLDKMFERLIRDGAPGVARGKHMDTSST